MRIRELHSVACQLVEVWRGHFGFWVVAPDITVTEIISKDDQDVRRAGGALSARTGEVITTVTTAIKDAVLRFIVTVS